MASKIINVTPEELKALNDELEFLKTTKRKEVVEAISVALSFGDLSENSEYDEAKNEQAKVETRIAELEEMLKHVRVISANDINTDIVNIGTKVRIYDEAFDEECEYSIVGSTGADPMANKISDQSPLGRALIGAHVGDTVEVEAPSGSYTVRVVGIDK